MLLQLIVDGMVNLELQDLADAQVINNIDIHESELTVI